MRICNTDKNVGKEKCNNFKKKGYHSLESCSSSSSFSFSSPSFSFFSSPFSSSSSSLPILLLLARFLFLSFTLPFALKFISIMHFSSVVDPHQSASAKTDPDPDTDVDPDPHQRPTLSVSFISPVRFCLVYIFVFFMFQSY